MGGAREPVALQVQADWRTSATAVGSIVSVLLVAVGLFYTNDANRKTNDASRRQQQLAVQGQVAERFSTAIGQLGQEGDDKLSIRLGGIYALERLMRDSAADEATVVQVLCAFVRTHSPRPNRLPDPVPTSPPDVQAAVVVLARRPNPSFIGDRRVDLSGTLVGLPGADLRNADLRNADLHGADLSGADLEGADLRGANLTNASLINANLRGVDLSGAHLGGIFMIRVDLDGSLHRTGLDGANLIGADLGGANLRFVSGLTSEQLTDARMDDKTLLPPGVVRPSPAPTR